MPYSSEQLLARRDQILEAVARVAAVLRTAPSWEQGVPEVLAILGQATGVSRVYIFSVRTDETGRQIARQLYEWAAPGVEPQIDVPELQHIDMVADGYQRWIDLLSAGHTIAGNVEDFPESERPLLEMQGILSMVLAPLFSGERWWGLIGFDACENRKEWSKAEVDVLRIAAESIGGAMHNQAREREMRRRVELLTEAVVELDADCRIRYVNPAWQALVGIAPSKSVGQRLVEFVHADDRAAVELQFKSLAGEGDARIEVRLQRPDGELRWVTLAMETMPEGGVVCAAHDFTAWRERADALAAAQARSQFLAKMSHEIRTPLNAILGLTYLAAQGGSHGSPTEHLRKIDRATRNMLATVNDILDFAKIEAQALVLEQAPFSLKAMIEGLHAAIAPMADRQGLAWTIDVAPDVPDALVGDAYRVEQILTNLCGNAVKFTEAGHVRLRVGLDAADAAQVTLRFEVEDSGIGMDEEQAAGVFAPFHQVQNETTRRFGGSGLGLTITKYLAETMGGHVAVRSTPGVGSTFTAKIVVARDVARGSVSTHPAPMRVPSTESTAGESPSAMASQPLVGLRVLVAEDNTLNQVVIRHLLERFGATPVIAENGALALEAYEKDGPFDLVLMDVQMPVMDGLEAARRLRELPGGQRVWIVAITANVTPEDRARCFAAGMDEFIPKPIEPSELREILASRVGRPRLPAARTT